MTRPEHVVGLVWPWVEYADELEARIEELEGMLQTAWGFSDEEFAEALGEGDE